LGRKRAAGEKGAPMFRLPSGVCEKLGGFMAPPPTGRALRQRLSQLRRWTHAIQYQSASGTPAMEVYGGWQHAAW
jgi:hypothetical protein